MAFLFFKRKNKKNIEEKNETLKKEEEISNEETTEVNISSLKKAKQETKKELKVEENQKTRNLDKKPAKKVYFVKKVDRDWQVILREGSKVIKKFRTKEEAEEYAFKLADNQQGTVLVHASKGKNKGRFQKSYKSDKNK